MHLATFIPILVMLAQVATSLPMTGTLCFRSRDDVRWNSFAESFPSEPDLTSNVLNALKARQWNDWADSEDQKREVHIPDLQKRQWNDWADSEDSKRLG